MRYDHSSVSRPARSLTFRQLLYTVLAITLAACGGGGGGSGGGSGGGGGGSSPGATVLSLTAGWHHTCARVQTTSGSKEVRCWGSNLHGELGDGTKTDRPTPVTVLDGSGPLQNVSRISAGRYTTCALLDNTEVRCWGWNEGGRLGDGKLDIGQLESFLGLPPGSLTGIIPYGNEADSTIPVPVTLPGGNPLNSVTAISTGSWHVCARRSDASAWCWGQNLDGALGANKDPATFDPFNPDWSLLLSPHAVQVADSTDPSGLLQNVSDVAAGSSDHTCALLGNPGRIRCWAWNGNTEGQLGNGDTVTLYAIEPASDVVFDGTGTPVTNATQIAAGGDHTCALLDTTDVVCWGWNAYGQVGDNTVTDAPKARYVQTSSGRLTKVSQLVSERGSHTCALRTDGTVWCWGDNRKGQLGNGTTTNSRVAVAVQGLPDPATDPVVALAAGGGGRDPVANPPGVGVERYDGGHTCALTRSGRVFCWGSNSHGQLGDGTTNDATTPVEVTGF